MSDKVHYNLACVAIIREQESKEPLYLILNTDELKFYILDKYEVQKNIDKVFNLVDITEVGDDDILFKHKHPIKIFHIQDLNKIKFEQLEPEHGEIAKLRFNCDIDTYVLNTAYRCAVEVIDDEINDTLYNYLMTRATEKELSVYMLYAKGKEFSMSGSCKVNKIIANSNNSINHEIKKANSKKIVLGMDIVDIDYVTSNITKESICYRLNKGKYNFTTYKFPESIHTVSYDLISSFISEVTSPFFRKEDLRLIFGESQYNKLLNQISLVDAVYSSKKVVTQGLDMLCRNNIIFVK